MHQVNFVDSSGIDAAGPSAPCGPTTPTGHLAYMTTTGIATLLGEGGAVLSTATLGPGVTDSYKPAAVGKEFECTWTIRFADVPQSQFYELRVEDHFVGSITSQELVADPYSRLMAV